MTVLCATTRAAVLRGAGREVSDAPMRGALYAVDEVAMPTNASFAFCFLFMTRYEVAVECDRFSFEASEAGRA